jgi:hypothetical protein
MKYSALSAMLMLVAAFGAQTSRAQQPQSSTQSNAKVPVTMTECETGNECFRWTLLGAEGDGRGPSEEVATLSIEHADAQSVRIRRVDSSGSTAGLTGVYIGVANGARIEGTFTSSWPGHWDQVSSKWYTMTEAPDPLQLRQEAESRLVECHDKHPHDPQPCN